jgi:hypothetical protein
MTMMDVYLIGAPTTLAPHQTGESRANYERPAGTTLPPSIPESQLFYWTRKWQADEAETVVELAEGRGTTFDNADEAIRWLLDPNG